MRVAQKRMPVATANGASRTVRTPVTRRTPQRIKRNFLERIEVDLLLAGKDACGKVVLNFLLCNRRQTSELSFFPVGIYPLCCDPHCRLSLERSCLIRCRDLVAHATVRPT